VLWHKSFHFPMKKLDTFCVVHLLESQIEVIDLHIAFTEAMLDVVDSVVYFMCLKLPHLFS